MNDRENLLSLGMLFPEGGKMLKVVGTVGEAHPGSPVLFADFGRRWIRRLPGDGCGVDQVVLDHGHVVSVELVETRGNILAETTDPADFARYEEEKARALGRMAARRAEREKAAGLSDVKPQEGEGL